MSGAFAQVPPSESELGNYSGLHKAAAFGDVEAIKRGVNHGDPVNSADRQQRTPLHVAIFQKKYDAARLLLQLQADPNRLEFGRYDIITIAAVANDLEGLNIAIEGGAQPPRLTSIYSGTALIAAAHLGHVEVVRRLIAAGAPLDHVNNLGWTALMESIVLGDGGNNHTETLRALVSAGADVNIADRSGVTPFSMPGTAGLPRWSKSWKAPARANRSTRQPPAATARCAAISTLARDATEQNLRDEPDQHDRDLKQAAIIESGVDQRVKALGHGAHGNKLLRPRQVWVDELRQERRLDAIVLRLVMRHQKAARDVASRRPSQPHPAAAAAHRRLAHAEKFQIS